MAYPKVSIIIPLYIIEPRFFEDLQKFKNLDYPNYEILVVCDKKVNLGSSKAKLIITGQSRTGPAEKRDIAIKRANGEICAFIDDDAYPDPKWLKAAVKNFKDSRVAGVGGPGVTPREDPYMAQLTGLVYSSILCGGLAQHRFVEAKRKYVVDYPAYNLLIRKRVLKEVGGYGNHFYGGEDTFLCLKIIKMGYKLLYDPEVIAYHHRRPLFVPYLKQIANIGKHRGYFAKKFPETSFSLFYFLPSLATVGFLALAVVSFFNPIAKVVFIASFVLSVALGALSVISKTNIVNAVIASFGIIMTHLTYGTYFTRGLLIKDLIR